LACFPLDSCPSLVPRISENVIEIDARNEDSNSVLVYTAMDIHFWWIWADGLSPWIYEQIALRVNEFNAITSLPAPVCAAKDLHL
jgi:hypothetical protein